MKIRMAFALLALTAMILACEYPSQTKLIESQISSVEILGLKVSPESGPQDFTLEVTYRVSWVSGFAIPAINCNWIGKTNKTSGVIETIDMAMHMGIKKPEEHVRLLPIFIPPKEDGSQAGSYYAVCKTEDGVSEYGSNDFVVEEYKLPTIMSVMNSPVTYTGSPQAATLQAGYVSPEGHGGLFADGTYSNVLYNGSPTVPVNAGTYTITADFTPDDPKRFYSLTAYHPGTNFVIEKAVPSLSVSNSPVTYDGKPHAAAVSASVPGTVSNVLTGGAASQTSAGSYAVTADFAPSDTTNYNNLTAAQAGDFVIQKPDFEAITGQIKFDISKVQSSRPSPGGELDWVTSNCIPDVSFGSDASISGSCEYTGKTVRFIKADVRVEVSGSFEPSGKVDFIYNVEEQTSNPNDSTQVGKWHITYIGKGNFSSPTQADGIADFNFSCSSSSSQTWCYLWDRTTEEFSGTIPWSFEAAP